LTDHKKLKKVVQTLPWFTYRKGFNPIGGTGRLLGGTGMLLGDTCR